MKLFFKSAFLLFIVAFTFAGSSNDTKTLKSSATFIDESTIWTEQLESDVLSEKLPHLDSVVQRFQATPESVAVSRWDSPIFPSLEDGFSLDVSSIDETALFFIDSFFNSFIDSLKTLSLDSQTLDDNKYKSLEPFFKEGRLYSLIIFLHDIEEKGIFPENYIVGKPFNLDETWECPIRLFMDDGTSIDISVCIEQASFLSLSEGSESQLETSTIEKEQWKILSLSFIENQKEE